MRVKVCGLHPIRDVQLCIDLGVNFLGFVFYKKSPRNLNLEDVNKLKGYDKKIHFLPPLQLIQQMNLSKKQF